ncbi:HAMP domain-containing protein [Rhizobium deserti]|uniref:histidine kinase n=1 Tax=Rhizobium deserti TaxID=2547961 RepID=A0A4R5UAC0_9HYPH|nr:ATP-binding protein [Rhizobium deserti]TDK31750.1 HAMP domain-containing protein [Rhizobium deserti]
MVWPRSTIQGQITAIILVCLLIVIVAGSTLERWVNSDYNGPDLEGISDRLSAVTSVLSAASPSERDAIVAVANRGSWRLSLQPISYAEQFKASSPDEAFLTLAVDWLFPPDNGTVPFGGWRTFVGTERVMAAKVDAQTLLVLTRMPPSFLRGDALSFGSNYLVALVTLIILFSVFAVWAITRPLRRIASAAMKADISLGPAPFEERGSVEIVALARALNGMQRRISTMVEARTRMLRGISHDLRTPLTRLRLRAERVKEDEVREGLLADVERIDHLLKESLDYLRDNHQREEAQRADLASLLQTVCDEFADMGHDVTYQGPSRLVAEFRPLALTRAVTNLCENAVKFGTKVEVTLSEGMGQAVVEVADDGPGIPDQYRNRVLEPFFKLDAARRDADAGFGLGLSIVSEIVEAHHGALELLDRQPKGLIARLTIPLGGSESTRNPRP